MSRFRRLLFRIFYSTSFTVVLLLVIAAMALTPGDAIYQCWKDHRLWDIGVIAGTYVLTALLAVMIYTSRLFTNRSVLLGIPKRYVPIDHDDLPGRLARMEITRGLERNAVIAFKARPRFEPKEEASPTASARISAVTRAEDTGDEQYAWAHIAHPGWASPASPDLPNLQFQTIIKELPDLIEAKAVSLAPRNPHSISTSNQIPLPDENLVAVLQRPLNMGLRDYIAHLSTLNLIHPETLTSDFLSLYERARFMAKPLDETEFRDLMGIFASILRGMTHLDPALLAQFPDPNTTAGGPSTTPQDRETLQWRTPGTWTPRSASTFSLTADLETSSVVHQQPRRVSEDSVPSLPTDESEAPDSEDTASVRTAPIKQPSRSRSQAHSTTQPSHTSSLSRRFLGSRSRSMRGPSASSYYSIRPAAGRSTVSVSSSASSRRSGGSVIRLRDASGLDGLPYTIEIPGARGGQGR